MEIEAKISGDYGGGVSSPMVSGPTGRSFTPAPSAGSYTYRQESYDRIPKKRSVAKLVTENKTKALLKPITQICAESPKSNLETEWDKDGQWRIYHHNHIEKCLTLPDRYIKNFGTEVWVITKFHYDIGTPYERRILKVFLKRDDRYACFDVYENWCEWIGECPRPLKDLEELFTI